MDPMFLLLVLGFLIIISAFYAASEIAIVSLPQVVVEDIRKIKPKIAAHLDYHRNNYQRFVINISIANNFINILASALATATLVALFPEYGVIMATVGMTFFILLFGEIIPKVLALNNTKLVASLSATPLWFSAVILTPFIYVFSLIVKMFSKNGTHNEEVSESALKYYIEKGFESGAINSTEKVYIDNIMKMDLVSVKEIMTPKDSVLSIPADASVRTAIRLLKKSGFSRAPVIEKKGNGQILGIIHAKDLLGLRDSSPVRKVIRETYFIPENKTVDSLLKDFQRNDSHFAIVLTVEGTYLGIVTAEDVIEEIVGEMYDETDQKVVYLKKINNKTYTVQGDFLISDFNKKFQTAHRNVTTVSGLIVKKLQRMPQKGDVIEFAKGKFEVLFVAKNKVKKAKYVMK